MPAVTVHPCFIQPKDNECRLWRYMDFTKFVWMIANGSLFFCRADGLEDPYEGSYSKANAAMRPFVYKDLPSELRDKILKDTSEFIKWNREWTYVNCWHCNEHESAAMWRLYAINDGAVAIVTSYQKLKDALPEDVYLGLIKYIDYESEWMPEGNTFYPIMHKRKSYEHEKEVRAVIQRLPIGEKMIEVGKHNTQPGVSVPVVLDNLIVNIFVAPTAPTWLFDLVTAVSVRYNVSAPVKKSDLFSAPVF